MTGKPITALTPVASYDELKRGDRVGYVFTGRGFVQSWLPGEIVAVDRDARLAVIRSEDGTLDTFEDGVDALALWNGPMNAATRYTPDGDSPFDDAFRAWLTGTSDGDVILNGIVSLDAPPERCDELASCADALLSRPMHAGDADLTAFASDLRDHVAVDR